MSNSQNQRKPIRDLFHSITWRNINVEILFEYLINFPQLIESFELKETFLDAIETHLNNEKDCPKKLNVSLDFNL